MLWAVRAAELSQQGGQRTEDFHTPNLLVVEAPLHSVKQSSLEQLVAPHLRHLDAVVEQIQELAAALLFIQVYDAFLVMKHGVDREVAGIKFAENANYAHPPHTACAHLSQDSALSSIVPLICENQNKMRWQAVRARGYWFCGGRGGAANYFLFRRTS